MPPTPRPFAPRSAPDPVAPRRPRPWRDAEPSTAEQRSHRTTSGRLNLSARTAVARPVRPAPAPAPTRRHVSGSSLNNTLVAIRRTRRAAISELPDFLRTALSLAEDDDERSLAMWSTVYGSVVPPEVAMVPHENGAVRSPPWPSTRSPRPGLRGHHIPGHRPSNDDMLSTSRFAPDEETMPQVKKTEITTCSSAGKPRTTSY
jgi:hypothetical protein